MKIDKDKLKAMCEMSDAELWREIRGVAQRHGFTLPEKTPEHSEMEKMRGAMAGGAKLKLPGQKQFYEFLSRCLMTAGPNTNH